MKLAWKNIEISLLCWWWVIYWRDMQIKKIIVIVLRCVVTVFLISCLIWYKPYKSYGRYEVGDYDKYQIMDDFFKGNLDVGENKGCNKIAGGIVVVFDVSKLTGGKPASSSFDSEANYRVLFENVYFYSGGV